MTSVTPRDRRALWLGALLVGSLIVWRGVAQPLAAALELRASRAATSAQLLAREQGLLRDRTPLAAALALARRRLDGQSVRVFSAVDTVGATASLAAWVRGAATAAGLREARIEAAPVATVTGGLFGVQVDARAQGDIAAVAAWLASMEHGERLLSVDRLELTGAGDGALVVSARVRGVARGGTR